MAIDPLGTPQPVKLAILPLAAARQAVRLTSEQNQQLREARLTADEKVQENRDAARAAAAEARAVEARAARQAQDTGGSENVSIDTGSGTESRGERVDIFA